MPLPTERPLGRVVDPELVVAAQGGDREASPSSLAPAVTGCSGSRGGSCETTNEPRTRSRTRWWSPGVSCPASAIRVGSRPGWPDSSSTTATRTTAAPGDTMHTFGPCRSTDMLAGTELTPAFRDDLISSVWHHHPGRHRPVARDTHCQNFI